MYIIIGWFNVCLVLKAGIEPSFLTEHDFKNITRENIQE
jgi:hypothetical protein